MPVVVVLLVWFLLSIPAALILGRIIGEASSGVGVPERVRSPRLSQRQLVRN